MGGRIDNVVGLRFLEVSGSIPADCTLLCGATLELCKRGSDIKDL